MIDSIPKCVGKSATLYFVDSSTGSPCKILDVSQGWLLIQEETDKPEDPAKKLLIPSTVIDSVILEGEEDEQG